jgi:DNA-binding NarL/FixJ family response regulator
LVLLSDDREALKQLIGIAAPGWALLLRESDSSEIIAAVLSAASGLITVDSSMVMQLAGIALGPSSAIYGDLPDPMTTRELEVLQLLAQGLPNKVIANRLNISQHTVKFHVAAILAKLNAGSRTEAVTLGARRGLVTI